MSNKMLIDASHPEETRVVVVRGNRIEEFDFESEHKKLLKGNIYLARVTRVEPSLQAAFVEYGGNRHGFLAFSEIHPDYYQIPVADRQALLEEEEKAALVDEEEDQESEKTSKNNRRKKVKSTPANVENETTAEAADDEDDVEQAVEDTEDSVELVGAEDALEEVPTRERSPRRQYKIQEVIKRRQILLVQVVKEERGNKGAAMTTYLSLAGRYSVLMPNTARGGGISRKITNIQDRKRLKEVVKDLHVPKGMGVILRTAGANRTKAEIKRDYEYLMRLWENVRALTLESVAPCLVYEEGSLIKRSIRDLYNKDISEILVSGEQGYREAKDFMRMLMPSHAKVVQPYREQLPIFAHNGIEGQLDAMLQPEVTLKSGGYLVINQTEALVAIDVNSGRSTKEHSIEETACQTNLEAAEEVARQLRLRDLAGLVVIDFIDMEEKRNNRLVEKKLKDCLKDDRARIQVGRISHFGLMEMSRQRIRASVLESTMQPCPHCNGTGYIRSDSSLALHVLRSIEEYLLRNPHFNIIVRTSVATALYVLNHKRQALSDLENRFGLTINIEADDEVGAQNLAIYKGTAAEGTPAVIPQLPPVEETEEDDIAEDEVVAETDNETKDDNNNENNQRRRRRNRGKSNDRNEEKPQRVRNDDEVVHGEEDNRRRRRRGRRGGRRYRDNDFERRRIPYAEPVGDFAERALAEVIAARRQRRVPHAEPVGFSATEIAVQVTPVAIKEQQEPETSPEPEVSNEEQKIEQKKPAKTRKRRTKKASTEEDKAVSETNVDTNVESTEVEKPAKPASRGRKRKTKTAEKTIETVSDDTENAVTSTEIDMPQEAQKPAKKTTRRSRKAKVEEQSNEMASGNAAVKAEKPARKSTRNTTRVKTTTAKNNETATTEPVVTSSDENEDKKPKRVGWWQRKGFF
ncbi:Rne/Rng family ribonuclease [Bartonella apis]|uniref:Ribonuclease E n=1 Tax=Bartonella apis TaxID=1686310 RepID=A0A1R0F7F8_9HYPH|nr:Rne/Rng family ribonuclease [Bartonella apis]MCT6823701.1 Rne/Rng family ribonuclease [Bartonella apis]MCT6859788.1 Rne/Rng family ribonuclease [Bartonella apis]OLY42903.1 ribonuclease E [Bartonella apis]